MRTGTPLICHVSSSYIEINVSLLFPVASEKDFVGADLVSVLHKLLSDERSAPEIKYNSMILICAVMGSGETHISFIQAVFDSRDMETGLRVHSRACDSEAVHS